MTRMSVGRPRHRPTGLHRWDTNSTQTGFAPLTGCTHMSVVALSYLHASCMFMVIYLSIDSGKHQY